MKFLNIIALFVAAVVAIPTPNGPSSQDAETEVIGPAVLGYKRSPDEENLNYKREAAATVEEVTVQPKAKSKRFCGGPKK